MKMKAFKFFKNSSYFPVDTRRRFNVYKTSMRRHRRLIDILKTLKQRHGLQRRMHDPIKHL